MNEHILILDDEPGITKLCTRLLIRAGYNVSAFTESSPAYQHLRSNEIDMLLVDIRMPGTDGFEVINHAKKLQPDIAVLVMTGYGTVETAIHALRQGVDGLLLKPFEHGAELVDTVKQALLDSERKRDAARINTLRPLFNVTESLLSETRRDKLMILIQKSIQAHLRCKNVGYYQVGGDQTVKLLSGIGNVPAISSENSKNGFLDKIVNLKKPIIINASGPGSKDFGSELQKLNLNAAMFTLVKGINGDSLLFAGRDENENPFREADLEMFLILSNQSAIALENARLYAELRDYVKQVEDSQQALLRAEKMATSGRLSVSIAHEVNNPLQAVQNCLHLAGREDLPEEKRKEYFDLANTELDRLMITVQRMLDFYRPGAVPASKVKLDAILKHVLDLLAQQLDKQKISVSVNLAKRLPEVFVVDNQIQQVFINLILNSTDAMPDGGELGIIAKPVKDGIEILIQDNGPGIPDESLPHIFEPFFSTKEGGTGLGLTVSYNIITAHAGTLEIISDNGPGTCFRLFLPIGGK
ncbi:MAG: response regulator [Anaerolineae bacterium]|nr:response regulator [Anaerolineae bacterium]MDK1080073.1 response regulator [Anaerolineae bacterium]MDK1118774.1 response regulator [Anaerolineae bacterium]